MEESATAATVPHILLVSFPGQGHINPHLRLAKRIAAKGPLVTFSSTIDVVHKLQTRLPVPVNDPIPIGKGHLRFEPFSDGWAADDPRRTDLHLSMAQQKSAGPQALSSLIQAHKAEGRPISCIINNPFVPWALDVAHGLSIPCGILWVQSAAVFSTYYHHFHSLAHFPSGDDPDVHVINLPGLPPLNSGDLPTFLLPTSPYKILRDVILAQFGSLHKATWVFLNSFDDLEKRTIEAMSSLRTPLIPVGPLVEGDDDGILKYYRIKIIGKEYY